MDSKSSSNKEREKHNAITTQIVLRKVNDIDECKRLWNKYSPKSTLWEDWDTASCFYSGQIHKPMFLEIMNNEEEMGGVLPLWFDQEFSEYCVYGGYFMESTSFWVDIEAFPVVFEIMPSPTWICDVDGKMATKIMERFPAYKANFEQNDFRYFLDLRKISYDINNHIRRFTKKHRKNLLYDLRKVEKLDSRIIWSSKIEDYDRFISLNLQRFGPGSDMSDPLFAAQMKSLLSLFEKKGRLHTSLIVIGGEVVGIEYGILFNEIYYVMNGGHDMRYPNVGKKLIWEHINKAIVLKAAQVDFMSSDSGWKELWNLEKEPYYVFKKGC